MLGLYTAAAASKKKRRVGVVCSAAALAQRPGPRQGRRPPPRPCRTAAKGRLPLLAFLAVTKILGCVGG
jgi:hypothetical protein